MTAPVAWNVDTVARQFFYVLLSRRFVRAVAAAMFFTTLVYVVLPLVLLPIVVVNANPPERSVWVSALVLVGVVLMFAAFAALTCGFTYLAVRTLSALATGAKRPISILLLLVLPATLVLGLVDLQQVLGPEANSPLWFLGFGTLFLHLLMGAGLVLGPMELRRVSGFDRAVLAQPRAGTGIRAEIASLLHLPDVRAFTGKVRQRARAWMLLSVLLEGFAFYVLLDLGETLIRSGQRPLPPLPGLAPGSGVVTAAGVTFVALTLALAFGFCRLLLGLARRCRMNARRLMLERAEDVIAEDKRPPILFLRAFREDQVPLGAARVPWFLRGLDPGSEHGSLEEMLVLNLTYVGPVVAVGDPSQQVAPVGAARWRLDDDAWQRFVEEQIRCAGVIVVGLAETAGVRWEVDAVRRLEALGKTIFVCPPDLARNADVLTLVRDALGCREDYASRPADDSYFLTAVRGSDGTAAFFTASSLTEMAYYVALRSCILRLQEANGFATVVSPADGEFPDRATRASPAGRTRRTIPYASEHRG